MIQAAHKDGTEWKTLWSSQGIAMSIFFGFAFLTWTMMYILGFNGLYGQDAHEYLRYSQELLMWIGGVAAPGKFFWPVNYPFWGAVLGSLLGSLLIGLQLLSILALGFVPASLYLILSIENPKHSSPLLKLSYCLLFCAASPFLWRSGTLIMSDAFAIGWLLLFYYGYWYYNKMSAPRYLVLLSIGAVAAVMTRYVLALLIVLPGIHILSMVIQRRHFLWLLGAGLLGLIFTLPHLFIRSGEPLGFLGHSYLMGWSGEHWFMRHFATNDGELSFRFPNLVYAFSYFYHPGFFCFGLLLLPFIRWRERLSKPKRLVLWSVLLYTLFIAGIPFQNQRFLLPLIPLSLLLWYPAFCRAIQRMNEIQPQLKWGVLSLVLVVQSCIFVHYSKNLWQINQQEKEFAEALSQYPAKTLYCFYYDGALRSYNSPHELINLWHEPIEVFETGSLVLFHPSRFEKQWEGHTLIENWERLNQSYDLVVLQELSKGWRLYEVRSQNPLHESDL